MKSNPTNSELYRYFQVTGSCAYRVLNKERILHAFKQQYAPEEWMMCEISQKEYETAESQKEGPAKEPDPLTSSNPSSVTTNIKSVTIGIETEDGMRISSSWVPAHRRTETGPIKESARLRFRWTPTNVYEWFERMLNQGNIHASGRLRLKAPAPPEVDEVWRSS